MTIASAYNLEGQPPWAAFSSAERTAARRVSVLLAERGLSDAEAAAELPSIVRVLLRPRSRNISSTSRAAANLLLDEGRVDLGKPFANEPAEISAAVLGAIAELVATTSADPQDIGFVSTPWRLAMDMAALAAYYWSCARIDAEPPEIRNQLWGIDGSTPGTVLSEQLQRATWYDPCIGGGVFPVSALLVMARAGVEIDTASIRAIHGCDVSTCAVQATSLRLSLAIASLRGEQWNPGVAELCSFEARDALRSGSEQEDAFGGSSIRADIVLGNPPYVRAARLPAETRSELQSLFPSIGGGFVDLYQYFLAHGFLALNPGGVLCYVSPASFQRSSSGTKTRAFLEARSEPKAVFDFDELRVFENASLHTSVYAVANRRRDLDSQVDTFAFQALPTSNPLLHGLISGTRRSSQSFTTRGWTADSDDSVLKEIEASAASLESVVGPIYSGIKTGRNTTYILNSTESAIFLDDRESAPFLRSVLVPTAIRRWQASWDGRHMIVPQRGDQIPSTALLMQHLEAARPELERRADLRPDSNWYELRTCAYFALFSRPKIVFPDIATEPRFGMDLSGHLISDGAFMLPGEDYFLLGVLNSKVADFYFRARCNRIGNPTKRGRLRFKKTYVRDLPIPIHARDEPAGSLIAEIAHSLAQANETSDSLQAQLDEAVVAAYNLAPQARRTIAA